MDLEHEHKINNITSEDVYASPKKNKETKTIDGSLYHDSDEHADTISDSIKQVDASNNTSETRRSEERRVVFRSLTCTTRVTLKVLYDHRLLIP